VAEKQTILIVEDELDLAEMLNAYFRVQGYEVMTAAWGEDAVRVCHEFYPDIVILDIRLPDIDGYEVCRQLRSHRRTASLPILFLTERRDRVDRLQGLELGAIDYITKPFDIQELRLRVRNALRRASLESLVNPVTGLPEGKLVDETLERMRAAEGWAMLAVSVHGLEKFREAYGFVASDDVLRAVSLMMNNAVREAGSDTDFVGHLSAEDFLIITDNSRVEEIRHRVESRLTQSMEYFYPLKDRHSLRQRKTAERLSVAIGALRNSDGTFADAAALKAAVLERRAPPP